MVTERPVSIYQQVLGARFGHLQPQLQDYFSMGPGSSSHGVGEGMFDVVGCPIRWLRPLLAPMVWDNSFFGEYGTSVPFSIDNSAHLDHHGRPVLSAVRRIHFPQATRSFEDVTLLDPVDGLLDYVGRRRLVATSAHLEVTDDGHMRISSAATRLLAGPFHAAVPAAVDAKAYTEQWWDTSAARFRIQTRVIQPQLGSIFVYAGHFDYRLVPA